MRLADVLGFSKLGTRASAALYSCQSPLKKKRSDDQEFKKHFDF
jgi:hypothetical protein